MVLLRARVRVRTIVTWPADQWRAAATLVQRSWSSAATARSLARNCSRCAPRPVVVVAAAVLSSVARFLCALVRCELEALSIIPFPQMALITNCRRACACAVVSRRLCPCRCCCWLLAARCSLLAAPDAAAAPTGGGESPRRRRLSAGRGHSVRLCAGESRAVPAVAVAGGSGSGSGGSRRRRWRRLNGGPSCWLPV